MDDIRFIDFAEAESALQEKAFALYELSFPHYERRSLNAHLAALKDREFSGKIVVSDSGELMGILFYWTHGNFIYVEHIAVNPDLRGRNIGSSMLEKLIASDPQRTVILEIDPPRDEISIRRLGFYERAGFYSNDYEYVHPSFTITERAVPHELVIMSHSRKITPEEFAAFRDYAFLYALQYVD